MKALTTEPVNYKNLELAVAIATRRANPDGRFDKQGRFYLEHNCPDCGSIRYPSARWPYSQLVHGRTVAHLADEYGIPAPVLRHAIRAAKAATKAA